MRYILLLLLTSCTAPDIYTGLCAFQVLGKDEQQIAYMAVRCEQSKK